MINKIQYKDKQSIQNDENVAEESKVTDTDKQVETVYI